MDVQALLDTQIVAALAALPPLGQVDAELLPAIRRQRAKLAARARRCDAVERIDHVAIGRDGRPDVTVRVYRPKGVEGPLPCVYWMHGGGMVLGTYDGDDPRFDRWCPMFNCVGVSVEYRLAPETPYPGPMDDCYTGLAWVHQNADILGIDRARLGIGGPSAGGGLAAGLGLLARDLGEVPLAFQLLIYPMIDDRMTTPSSQWDVPIWAPSANRFGWASYLGDLTGGDVPIYAAPARAAELAGLPPSYIMVGTLDGFLDEDLLYAQRLNQAGVATELHVYPGAPHGFDGLLPDTDVSHRAERDIEYWLGKQLNG